MNGTTQEVNTHYSPMQLQEYLDGELPSKVVTTLSQHVDSCAECSSELFRTMRLYSAIEFALDDPYPIPANFAEVVATNADRQCHRTQSQIDQMTVIILITSTLSIFVLLYLFSLLKLVQIPVHPFTNLNVF